MNKEHLKGRTPLTIVRQSSQCAFFHRIIYICVLQDDPSILGFEAEYATQAMRFRMLVLQNVSNSAAANECQHIDSSGFHEGTNDFLPLSVDCVDHTSGKGIPKGPKKWLVEQNPQFRWLENHSIAHDECWNQGREGFIERVVEGSHAEHHAERRTTNLPDHALLDNET
jgi:hypothetical protein